MMKHFFQLGILMAGLAPGMGWAGLIGEPAPQFNLREWMQGKPVEIGPGTNIYVVEVWETTSDFSRACITNLNAVQNRYKNNGVVVVGVSDEPVSTLLEFLKQGGTNIQYSIAADNQRHTSLSYMKPEGMRTIPYAFVVGTNGHLLWHGPPLPAMNEVLEQIISGRYDEELAAKRDLARHQLGQYLALARQGNDRVQMTGRNLLANRTNDLPLLCEMAVMIATYPQLATRDFALAGEALDDAEKLAGNSSTNQMQVQLTRAYVLFESGKPDEGLAKAKQLLASAQNPLEQTNLQMVVRQMEAKLSGAKSHPNNAGQPGAAHSASPVPAAKPNQGNASDPGPVKNSAGNP